MGQEIVPVSCVAVRDSRAPSRSDLARLLRALRALCVDETEPSRALESYQASAALELNPVHFVDISL